VNTFPQHEELLRQSDKFHNLAERLQATDPTTREEWEAIIELRNASRCLFSAAGWLARLERS
jgi:hypothetical protein